MWNRSGPISPGQNIFYKYMHYTNWCTRGPFYWHGSGIIPAWISNYIHHKIRDFYLPKFQDIVWLKFWKSWTFPNFRTISVYIEVNFICLWYTWWENVLLQNSASRNPEKVWNEITLKPFPNFNGAAIEVWEWISNFIPRFIGIKVNPCWYMGPIICLHLSHISYPTRPWTHSHKWSHPQ